MADKVVIGGAPIEASAVAASQEPALVAFARGEVDAHRRVARPAEGPAGP